MLSKGATYRFIWERKSQIRNFERMFAESFRKGRGQKCRGIQNPGRLEIIMIDQ